MPDVEGHGQLLVTRLCSDLLVLRGLGACSAPKLTSCMQLLVALVILRPVAVILLASPLYSWRSAQVLPVSSTFHAAVAGWVCFTLMSRLSAVYCRDIMCVLRHMPSLPHVTLQLFMCGTPCWLCIGMCWSIYVPRHHCDWARECSLAASFDTPMHVPNWLRRKLNCVRSA